MDLILLVVIPLALIKDLCFNENAAADDLKHRAGKSTKKYSNKLCTGLACCCFAGLFLVDAFIFNMYFHEADVNELKGVAAKAKVEAHSFFSTFNFLQIFTSVQS